MNPPLKTDQKKKDGGEVGREPNPSSPTELKQRQKSWQEEREGSGQAQELRPILFLREGGREGKPGRWFPSPVAIKHLHFCRGVKFLRDLESSTQSLHLQKGCAWVFCR